MPHRTLTIWPALVQLLERYREEIYVSLIVALVEVGRLLYFGGKWRKTSGETLICLVLAHVVRSHIPFFPPIPVLGWRLTQYDVAFLIGVCGVRGIRRAVEWAIHRSTGAKIKID